MSSYASCTRVAGFGIVVVGKLLAATRHWQAEEIILTLI